MVVPMHVWLAALLACLAPAGLLITRRELRRMRSLVVEELIATVFKNERGLPQVELALSRYRSLRNNTTPGMPTLGRHALASPHLGAAVFAFICLLGFLMLFTPFDRLMGPGAPNWADGVLSTFWTSPEAADNRIVAMKTVSVAGFGFLGGYIFQLSFLTRATLNQELSALSFVRASFRLLIGIILAVITYRALDGLIGMTPDFGSADPPSTAPAEVVTGFGAALGVAFLTGFWPDGAISALSRRLKVRLKLVSQSAMEQAEVIPVEVLDGIDSEVSFRLQESNIYDVQNLATANPITLYAETPFGLFECFDWILQAQLCLVVGPTGFAALKRHNVRTIFDLERGVLAKGAPEDYVTAIAGVVLGQADKPFQARIGMCDGSPSAIRPEVIRHVVALMGDDLHVHRLRALWRALTASTAGEHPSWLFETGWLPGEGEGMHTALTLAQIAAIAQIAALGEAYRLLADDAPQTTREDLRAECLALVTAAAGSGPEVKNRLRRLWDPNAPRKRDNEHSLEPFFGDEAFKRLLD